jgi:hypothetical protein
MTKLIADGTRIELANCDTQFVVTDLEDGTVQVYLEHDNGGVGPADALSGTFSRPEIVGLADLLYLRYSRKVELSTTVIDYDA